MRLRKLALVMVVMGALTLISSGAETQGQGAPTAQFAFSPPHPDVNTEVILDASASHAPGGHIVSYEWDLDGDGQYEESRAEPVLTRLFEAEGARIVTLRVVDDGGRSSTASQTVTVRGAPVTIRRSISTPLAPNRVPAGSSFQVTITLRANEAVNGLGLDEDLPAGWRASSVETDGAVYKGSELQWLWFETLGPGETRQVVYNVTVPRSAAGGTFEIAGVASSFSPRFEIALPGDDEVRVI